MVWLVCPYDKNNNLSGYIMYYCTTTKNGQSGSVKVYNILANMNAWMRLYTVIFLLNCEKFYHIIVDVGSPLG